MEKPSEFDKNIPKTETQWQKELPAEVYHVCREKGTERPFTGALLDEKRQGQFICACCQQPLFNSDAKYDSGSGWPSFYSVDSQEAVVEVTDTSVGMTRTEVMCSSCQAHLGHVFSDGPEPTGLRYCINSLSLQFSPVNE